MSCAPSPPPAPRAGGMLPRKVGPGLALNSIEAITSNLLTFITERSLSVGFNRINRFLSRQDRIPRPAGTQGSRGTVRRITESVWGVGVLGVALRARGVSLRSTCWTSRDNCGTRMTFVKPGRRSACFGADVYRLPVHVVWGRQPRMQNPTIHPKLSFPPRGFVTIISLPFVPQPRDVLGRMCSELQMCRCPSPPGSQNNPFVGHASYLLVSEKCELGTAESEAPT